METSDCDVVNHHGDLVVDLIQLIRVDVSFRAPYPLYSQSNSTKIDSVCHNIFVAEQLKAAHTFQRRRICLSIDPRRILSVGSF